MKIKDLKIKCGVPDSLYYTDPGRIGSTQYSAYCQCPGALASDSLRDEDEDEGRALVFGKLVHAIIDKSLSIDDYTISKYKTTSSKMINNKEIGSDDYNILRRMIDQFPLDLKRIKEESEIFEQEVGYFLDFELEEGRHVKVRCKPDLLFQLYLSNEIELLDFKTTSESAFASSFQQKYKFQAELYAFCVHYIHKVTKIIPTTYYFEKKAPYIQRDLVMDPIIISDIFLADVMDKLIEASNVMERPVCYLKYNNKISSKTLLYFSKN